MILMNDCEVRVARSQRERGCRKALAREPGWTIFSCRFQLLGSGAGVTEDCPQAQGERSLYLRKSLVQLWHSSNGKARSRHIGFHVIARDIQVGERLPLQTRDDVKRQHHAISAAIVAALLFD